MNTIEWKVGELFETKKYDMTIIGNPKIVYSRHGKAIQFNGIDDGIIFNNNPILGLSQFTIEMNFFPESGGQFEQRFLHCGLIQSDRLLLELRSTKQNQWYLDAFIAAGESSLALVDENILHPNDQWHHAAFVIDNGFCISYINGVKELEGKMDFSPIQDGAASIGMRQNKISWFKGMLYNLIVTSTALKPGQFNR